LKLFACKLLTDENIHPSVVNFLRQQSCDVEDVSTLSLIGHADEVILKAALDQERIVVTHDRDFGRLAIYLGSPFTASCF
jgi:predicted nuclease of predicted toxin-antitoxin system